MGLTFTNPATRSRAGWQADEVTQWVWGMEYIDELLSFMRDTKDGEGETPADGRFDDASVKVYHAAHDRLYSVVALLDSMGEIVERVRYNAYGLARQSYPGDFNADGVNGGFGEINFYLSHAGSTLGNTSSSYNVHVDANGDGVVDTDDFDLFSGMPTPSPSGWVSGREHRSVVGYAGYLHDAAAGPDGGMYLARHRWMDPVMGRWVTRDPAGYVDGQSMYQFVRSSPNMFMDSSGRNAHHIRNYASILAKNPSADGIRDQLQHELDLYHSKNSQRLRSAVHGMVASATFLNEVFKNTTVHLPIVNPVIEKGTCCKGGKVYEWSAWGTQFGLGLSASIGISREFDIEKDARPNDCKPDGQYYELLVGPAVGKSAGGVSGQLSVQGGFRKGPDGIVGIGRFSAEVSFPFGLSVVADKFIANPFSADALVDMFSKVQVALSAGFEAGSFSFYYIESKPTEKCCE